jgi:molybdopterin converting factor subunit 1
MRVKVLLFAALREAAGASQLDLTLEESANGSAVLDELAQRLPERRALLDRSALAVNEVYASADVTLREGDTVAVIPPVSGGECDSEGWSG